MRIVAFPLFATLALAPVTITASTERSEEEPRGGPRVVIKAFRFSGHPPSYTFKVTNNGTMPIDGVAIGIGPGPKHLLREECRENVPEDETFIERTGGNSPTSIGSPGGWEGRVTYVTDPRLPESHSETMLRFLWTPKHRNMHVQPGRSLSGFSLQLPTVDEMQLAYRHYTILSGRRDFRGLNRPSELLGKQPDLTKVQFVAYSWPCSAFGTVELD